MLKYDSVRELVCEAQKRKITISELVIRDQVKALECTESELIRQMEQRFKVMKEAVNSGLNGELQSASGLSGKDALKLRLCIGNGGTVGGPVLGNAVAKAIAAAEVNACMGRIVAAPTAGSSGIVPAVILTVMEQKGISHIEAVKSLFNTSGIGMVIAGRASLSGAESGCQAECGSASAMAASAAVELAGGTPDMCAQACAIALKNVLGLVCDPVAGLVEVPCIKRNAMGTANALVAADLALSGVRSVIPADEVIDAMSSIGNMMAPALKETSQGGLADTPAARKLEIDINKEFF